MSSRRATPARAVSQSQRRLAGRTRLARDQLAPGRPLWLTVIKKLSCSLFLRICPAPRWASFSSWPITHEDPTLLFLPVGGSDHHIWSERLSGFACQLRLVLRGRAGDSWLGCIDQAWEFFLAIRKQAETHRTHISHIAACSERPIWERSVPRMVVDVV